MRTEQKSHQTQHFRHKLFIIITTTLVLSSLLIILGLTISRQMIMLEDQWQKYNNQSSKSIHAINQIKVNFGYGGFIHNFKNYVLRQDNALLPVIEKNIDDTYQAIKKYQSMVESKQEQQAIEDIENVVNQYRKKMILSKSLVAKELSSNAIDAQVKVDDQPALEAFQFLYQKSFERYHQQKQLTGKTLNKILFLLSLGITLLPIFFIFAWFFYQSLKKMIITSEQLDNTSQYLNDIFESIPDSILIVTNVGNIIQANHEAEQLSGYNHDELLSLNIEQLIPEQSRALHKSYVSESFEKHIRISARRSNKLKILTKEQQVIPVEISINYSFFNNQQLAIVSLRNIFTQVEIQKKLENKEKMLSVAQSIAHIGSWDWDLRTNDILWSDEMHHIFGLSSNQFGIHYDTFVQHLHPDDREEVVNALNATVIMNTPLDLVHRIIRTDQSERIVHLRGEMYIEDDSDKQHLVGTLHDITQFIHTENELRLADNVFNHTEEGILITDKNNHILRVNPAFSKISGYSSDEAMGKDPKQLFKSGKHDQYFYEDFWSTLINKGTWSGEIWNHKKDGSLFPSWQNISAIKDENDNIIQYLSIFSDITDKKQSEEHIQQLAQYDQLTGLPNRNLFNDRLNQALLRAKRANGQVALMFIDLDRFKHVNDTLGHQAGDSLLKEVAVRLNDCVRKQDTVARLGGDEFTIILEQIKNQGEEVMIANKILSRLSEKVILGEQAVTIGGSIGISLFPSHGTESEQLIKNADLAMYQAKHLGKNQYRFYTDELSS